MKVEKRKDGQRCPSGLRYLAFIALLAFPSVMSAETDTAFVPYESVATSEDATSLVINPAGTARHPGQLGYFYGSLAGGEGTSHAGFLTLPLVSFAYDSAGFYDQQLSRDVNVNRFHLGLALGSRSFSVGTSYAWYYSANRQYDNLTSWDVGFQYRPSGSWLPANLLAFGFTGRDLNAPQFNGTDVDPRLIAGIGVRPFLTNTLTFSADFEVAGPDSGSDVPVTLGAKLFVPRNSVNMFVSGAYNTFSEDVRADFGFEFSSLRLYGNGSNSRYGRKADQPNYGFGMLINTGERFTAGSSEDKYIELVLKDKVVERKSDSFFFPSTNYTVFEIVTGLERAKEDSGIKGIILRIDSFSAGLGKLQEIRNALVDFRDSGKELIVYLENPGNKEYYLGSAGSRVIMPPNGTVALLGLKAELFFFRDLLDKIGVQADFIPIGEYKSAMETFMRDEPSAEARKQVSELLAGLGERLRDDIAKARKMGRARLDDVIDTGFMSAKAAQDKGLIDGTEYYEDLKKDLTPSIFDAQISPAEEYFAQRQYIRSWGSRPKIAIVHIDGAIVTGESSDQGLFASETAGSDTLAVTLTRLADDDLVKGVILRIDSPGGSGLASDIIWNGVQKLKKAKKKVYVSFSDVAASGGYYIAAAGDKIFANPGTVTGSIGVFGGKFSIGGLYKKLGINKTTIARGKNAAMFSEDKPFSQSERALLQEHLKEFYEIFVSRVSEGRGLDRAAVHEVAKGRVWTGEQAKSRKLVDNLGGLKVAMEMMKQDLGLDHAQEVPVEYTRLPERKSLFASSSDMATWLGISPEAQEATRLTMKHSRFKDNEIVFIIPFIMDVR